MSLYRVDGEDLARLGGSLVDLAESLAALGDSSAELPVLGPGSAGAALGELLDGWRLARRRLAEALVDLGEATALAGGAYLETDSAVRTRLGGGVAR